MILLVGFAEIGSHQDRALLSARLKSVKMGAMMYLMG